MDDNGYVLPDSMSYSFQTASQPYIVSVSPEKDTTTMKPTDPIVFNFSKPMKSDIVTIFTVTRAAQDGVTMSAATYDKTLSKDTDYTADLSADGKALTFKPSKNIHNNALWDYNTRYTIATKSSQIVKDDTTYGNAINDIKSFLNSMFTTVSSTDVSEFAFVTASVDPLDVQVNEFTNNKGINVTFTEPLSASQKAAVVGSLRLTTKVGADEAVETTISSYSWSIITVDGAYASRLQIATTTASLPYNATCTVTIGGLKDLNGVSMSNKTYVFHTTAKPTVVSTYPANGSRVLPGNQIEVTFSKPMLDTSLSNITLTTGLTNVGLTNVALSTDGLTMVASPSARLEPDTDYTLTIPVEVLDAQNNPLDHEYEITFSVHARSGLASVSPVENAVDVLCDSNIVITFRDNMSVTDNNKFRLKLTNVTDGNSDIATDTYYNGSWNSPTNTVYTLIPEDGKKLPNNKLIKVTIDGIKDQNGYLVDYGLAAGRFEYTFNTATMPTIIQRVPSVGEENVLVTQPIVITFDKPMKPETLTHETIAVTETSYGGNSGRELQESDFDYSYRGSNHILTITPTAANSRFIAGQFAYNSAYTVTITSANITDADSLGNNPLNGDYTYSFSTIAETAPTFADFKISRDRTTLTASYVVKNNGSAPISGYGFSIKQGDNSTSIAESSNLNRNGQTVAGVNTASYTTVINTTTGEVTYFISGLNNNTSYEIDPYVTTSYGTLHYNKAASLTFILHPWNLENNYSGNNLTAVNEAGNKFVVDNLSDLKDVATEVNAGRYNTAHYLQTNKITADSALVSIGAEDHKFAGNYVGAEISGLQRPLFAYTDGGSISNIIATNVGLSGSYKGAIIANNVTNNTSITNNTVVNNSGILTNILYCIAKGGVLSGNTCQIHDHRSKNTTFAATDQKYLATQTTAKPTVDNAKLIDLTTDINGATNVATNTQLVFTFSKPMDEAECIKNTAFTFKDSSSNDVTCAFTWDTISTSDSASKLTVTPVEPLKPATVYTVKLLKAVVKDIFGTAPNADYTYTFTTSADVSVNRVEILNSTPSVIAATNALTPNTNDVANVPVDATIRFTLNGTPSEAASFTVSYYDLNNNPNTVHALTYGTGEGEYDYTVTPTTAAAVYTIAPKAETTWNYASKYVISMIATDSNDVALTYTYSFVTATQPAVIGHSPAANATMALTNGTITIAFNKPMDIDGGDFAANTNLKLYKYNMADLEAEPSLVDGGIAAGLVWSADHTTVIASTAARLEYNTKYKVTVTGAKDADTNRQNTISDYSWSFTTGDTSYISSIVLKSGEATVDNLFDAPVNSKVVVTFATTGGLDDEQIAAVNVAISGVNKSTDEAAASVTLTPSWDGSNKILTLTPTANLAYYSKYTVTLSGMKDDNGYVLPDSMSYSFQTASQPYIVSVSPTGSMKPTDPIVFNFSKPMKSDAVEKFTVARAAQGGASLGEGFNKNMTRTTEYTATLSTDGKVITFAPVADIHSKAGRWDYNTRYTITGTASNIKDSVENSLTDIKSFLGSTFTTVSSTDVSGFAFKTVSVDPLDVPVAEFTNEKGIYVTFTEPLSTAQQTAVGVKLTTKVGAGEAIETTVASKSWSIITVGGVNASRLQIATSTEALPYNATCTVTISGLTDLNGVAASNKTYVFHTTAKPTVVSTYPANGSRVLPGNQIEVTFSKPMKSSTLSNITLNHDLTLTRIALSTDGLTMVASPSARLEPDTEYTLTIPVTVLDAQDNPLDQQYVITFSVHARSGLASVSPVENAVDVPCSSNIVITFRDNKSVTDDAAFPWALTNVTDSSEIATNSYVGSWNGEKTVYTITPNGGYKLPNNKLIKVTINGIKDQDGYLVDYGLAAGRFEYTFNTATMPVVLTATPTSDVLETKVTEPIVIAFSKSMNTSLTNTAITISEKIGAGDPTDVTENFNKVWSGNNKVLTMRLTSGNMKYNASYTVSIAATAADSDGNLIDLSTNVIDVDSDTKTSFCFSTVAETAPTFADFKISRDRRTLTASYVVRNNGSVDFNGYGFSIKQGENATNIAQSTSGTFSSQTVAGVNTASYTTVINASTGEVTYYISGLSDNTEYEIDPYVTTSYGIGKYNKAASLTFKLHPWNLENNYSGNNLTAVNEAGNKFIVNNLVDLKSVATEVNAGRYNTAHYLQTNKITADGALASIGAEGNKFAGNYVGAEISGLKKPLFGYTNGGSIINVTATDVALTTAGAIIANDVANGTTITNNTVAGSSDNVVYCISNGGVLSGNTCQIHDHRSVSSTFAATDQKYLKASITTAPTITSAKLTNPDAAISANTGVASTTQVVIEFSRPMNEALVQTSAISIAPAAEMEYSWADKAVDDSASKLTLTFKKPLKAATGYTLTITKANAKDIFGTAIDTSGNIAYSFKTSDAVSVNRVEILNSTPSVIAATDALTPNTNDVANVPINATIRFTLNGTPSEAASFTVSYYDLNNNPNTPHVLEYNDNEEVSDYIVNTTDNIVYTIATTTWNYATKYVISMIATDSNEVESTYTYSFVTASQPVVIGHSPSDGANMVLTNAPIVISFSKPIDTSTVVANTSLKLALTSNLESTVTLLPLSWSSDNMTVIASPSVSLANNTGYTVILTTAITDNDANRKNAIPAEYSWSFTTCDTSYIRSFALVDGSGASVANSFDAPVDAKIKVTFGNTNTLSDAQKSAIQNGLTLAGISLPGGAAIAPAPTINTGLFNWTDAPNSVLTITPTSLNYYSKYTLSLSGIKDDNGYVLPDTISYDFQTASQPYIVSIYPASATTSLKPTDSIIYTFSKPMHADTVASFTLTRTSAAGANMGYTTAMVKDTDYTVTLSGDGKVLTFAPKKNIHSVDAYRWDYNTTYTIATITNKVLRDVNENAVISNTAGSAIFTTVSSSDISAFAFVTDGIDPLDVPVAEFTNEKGIYVTFTEPLSTAQITAVEDSLKLTTKVGSDAAVETTIASYSWSIVTVDGANASRLQIATTTASLPYNATCTVTIGGLTDLNGVEIAAKTYVFHTTARPTVVSSYPANGSRVLQGNQIEITFSKPMDTSAGNIAKVVLSGGGLAGTGLTNAAFINGNCTLIASPSIRLLPDTEYTITIDKEIVDASGNAMSADANTVITFNTHAASGLASVSPLQNAVDVATTSQIIITMFNSDSEPTYSIASGGTSLTERFDRTSWTSGVLTLTPKDGDENKLPNNALITVTLTNIKDQNGYLADYGLEVAGEYTYTFNTAVMPVIITATPTADVGVQEVKVTEPIVITFSKSMDTTLTNAAISVSEKIGAGASTNVTGSFEKVWSGNNKVLTMRPTSGDMKYNASYTVNIAATAADSDGNQIDLSTNVIDVDSNAKTSFCFSTVAETSPTFRDFRISRDKTTLTATYIVENNGSSAFTGYGLKIKKDEGEFNDLIQTTGAFAGVTVNSEDLSGNLTLTNESNGNCTVTYTVSGFENGVTYQVKPYVTAATVERVSDSALSFVVHPWNLQSNYDGSNLTATNSGSNKFIVNDLATLKAVATEVNVGRYNTAGAYFFIQTEAIAADAELVSIGTSSNKFAGTYVGNSVTGLQKPLFGYVNGANISNLNLTTSGFTLSEARVGVLAQSAEGASVISNSVVTISGAVVNSNTVDAVGNSLGGVVGYLFGTSQVNNCRVVLNAALTANTRKDVGGVVGYVGGTAQVNNSSVSGTGAITADTTNTKRAGGIVGYAVDGTTVKNNTFDATSTITGKNTGCIAGNIETINTTKHAGNICLQHNHPINASLMNYMSDNLTAAPTATVSSPANNATDVDIGAQVTINFDKPMDTATTESAISLGYSLNGTPTTISGSALSFAWNSAYTQVVVTPVSPLYYNTVYSVNIADATAKDRWLGANEKTVDVTSTSFTTAVGNSPAISSLTVTRTVADDSVNTVVVTYNTRVTGGVALGTNGYVYISSNASRNDNYIKEKVAGSAADSEYKANATINPDGSVSITLASGDVAAMTRNTDYYAYPCVSTSGSSAGYYSDVTKKVAFKLHPWAGSGTEADPFIIHSVTHLTNLLSTDVDDYMSAYYEQTANIDIASYDGTMSDTFSGHYNGEGKTISNLAKPLFNAVAVSGSVKDLTITIEDLTGAGSVANSNSGTISNVSVSGTSKTITGESVAGGIVGANTGNINNCQISGSITVKTTANNANVGGIAGTSTSGTVSGNKVSDSVTVAAEGTTSNIGGILGSGNGTVSNNSVASTVTISTTNATSAGCIKGANAGTLSGNICSIHDHPANYNTYMKGNLTSALSVSSTTPANSATDVAVNTQISVVFDKPVSLSTINSTNITLLSTVDGRQDHGSLEFALSSDAKTLTITPKANVGSASALMYKTGYTLTLTTNVQDIFGVALTEATSAFTTVDGAVPTVTDFEIATYTKSTAMFAFNYHVENGAPVTDPSKIKVQVATNNTFTSGLVEVATNTLTANLLFDVSGLTRNTTYYARAKVTNVAGDGYSTPVVSFTTPRLDKNGEHYLISDADELAEIQTDSTAPNKTSKYILTDNITLTSTWTPADFSGELLGNGKTITAEDHLANGMFDTMSGKVNNLTVNVAGDHAYEGFAKSLSGDLDSITITSDSAVAITLATGKGLLANSVSAGGSISNANIGGNITLTGVGTAGCMAATNAGYVSVQGQGNTCSASGHSHASGDSLVGNLNTAPKLVSTYFVSKSGKVGGGADRVFGDWATDVRIAGDIELNFEFDKAVDASTFVGAITPATSTTIAPNSGATKSIKVTIPHANLPYATEFAYTLDNTSENRLTDTLGNKFGGYNIQAGNIVKNVWNFTTIGGKVVMNNIKAVNVTGSTADIVFSYEKSNDAPAVSALNVIYNPVEGASTTVPVSLGEGSAYIVKLTSLARNKQYFVRASATNAAGIATSTTITFTTNRIDGLGTVTSPYQITDATEFALIGTGGYSASDYYVLTSNITLTSGRDITFAGDLNGDGKTVTYSGTTPIFTTNTGSIYNMTIDASVNTTASTFATLVNTNDTTGVIRNVTLSGTITDNEDDAKVAGLVYTNNGTVDGCTSSATITANGEGASVGGLVYINNSADTVRNSSNSGAITATNGAVGAIAYSNPTGSITNCANTGDIEAKHVSGCVYSNGGLVINNFNSGTLTASVVGDNGCIIGTGSDPTSGNVCSCGKHDSLNTPIEIAENLKPAATITPATVSVKPTGWSSFVAGVTLDSYSEGTATLAGPMPFYEKDPKDGTTSRNLNMWVVEIGFGDTISTDTAKVNVGEAGWKSLKNANYDDISYVDEDSKYYVKGAGESSLTIVVDNDGESATTYDQTTIIIDPSGCTL